MSDDTSIYEGLNLDISIDEYLDPKFVSNTLSADSLANDNLQSSHRLELVTLVVKRLFENCLPYGIQSVSYLEKQGYAFCDDLYLKTGTDNRVSLSLFAVGLNHI